MAYLNNQKEKKNAQLFFYSCVCPFEHVLISLRVKYPRDHTNIFRSGGRDGRAAWAMMEQTQIGGGSEGGVEGNGEGGVR